MERIIRKRIGSKVNAYIEFNTTIFPRINQFRPDLLFLSSGFDAHIKEDLCKGYGALLEYDYFLMTKQLTKLSEELKFPIISVLEGGYNTTGYELSPFAVSVLNHLNGFVLHTNEPFEQIKMKRVIDPECEVEPAPKKAKVEDDEIEVNVDE